MAVFVDCGVDGYVRCEETGCVVLDNDFERAAHGAAHAAKLRRAADAGPSRSAHSLVSEQAKTILAQREALERAERLAERALSRIEELEAALSGKTGEN